jgi:protein-tyrosine phosphatase
MRKIYQTPRSYQPFLIYNQYWRYALTQKFRICFVCLGNIVRSPLAEHLFMHSAKEAGVADRYDADSAGTGSWHVGERPDGRMRRVAASHGLVYDGYARQFQPSDLDHFDLIIAMDRNNYAHLLSLASTPEHHRKIQMLREYDPQGRKNAPVPDPYYGGIDGFEETYQIVERSVKGLLSALEE